jgi:hypothetical protein
MDDEYSDVARIDPGGELVAFTWGCYSIRLDLETGRIKSALFTK